MSTHFFYPPLLSLLVLILSPATEATAESNSFRSQELAKFSNDGGLVTSMLQGHFAAHVR